MRAALAAAVVSLGVLAGCPGTPDARVGAGACDAGFLLFDGACVPRRLADAFCGRGATPRAGGGCVRRTCAPGEALDTLHGLCLPESSVYATLLHGRPGDDDDSRIPTCHEGTMTSLAGRIACTTGRRSCARGERFVPAADAGVADTESGACQVVPPCGAGAMYDPAARRCTAITRGGPLDVGTWARLALGPDGGEGSADFCAPVRATMAGPRATAGGARFEIRLIVPDNDVTQTSGRLVGRAGTSTAAVDAAGRSLDELVGLLHFYGGRSRAASVSLEVSCSAPPASEPMLEAAR